MSDDRVVKKIASVLQLKTRQVDAVMHLKLIGATIPFMARYRKEKTENLDENQIRNILELWEEITKLEERKKFIKKTLQENSVLDKSLEDIIDACENLLVLEEIYSPYKKKKKTKADIAMENGLLKLADFILDQGNEDLRDFTKQFLNEKILTMEDAWSGARDIIAEKIHLDENTKARFRQSYYHNAILNCSVVKSKQNEALAYKDYFNYNEQIKQIPSHRFLAIHRAFELSLLRIKFEVNSEHYIGIMTDKWIKKIKHAFTPQIILAIKDAWERLIKPSLDAYWWSMLKEKSDEIAIEVFGSNLYQLLMEAPLVEQKVLAIDPGYVSGSKVAILNEYGQLIDYGVIYPLPPKNQKEEAVHKLTHWIDKFQIKTIAIGDGTGGRDLVELLKQDVIFEGKHIELISEKGASVYSASLIAGEELPNVDITIRGAASIGRRIQDPLAELIKIDPKSIGVGQYQHEVNQHKLKNNLDHQVLSAVHKVGINLNTASKYLLQYISGIGPVAATEIIKYRNLHHGFKEKSELLSVPKIGPKAFELCSGFVRISNGKNKLDNTGIHPEKYPLVERMARSIHHTTEDLIQSQELCSKLNIKDFVSHDTNLETLQDIMNELAKPGHDPRGQNENFSFDQRIRSIDDLQIGMVLNAVVINITKFGAFVDLGIKTSGFVHISQISHRFIKDPSEVLKLKQRIEVKVLELEPERGRISLTLKY